MANTLFTGKVYHHFEVLASTNAYAQALLSKNKPAEGTVVRADSQSAGQGQFGSRWESAPGKNLLLSIIYYPSWLPLDRQFYLSMAVGLGVYDAAKLTIHSPAPVNIKWPNDVYVNSRKVAGILIQASLSGPVYNNATIGIGLNVNQLEFDKVLPNASSLAREIGVEFNLEEVENTLFECIEARYLQLKAGQHTAIKMQYEAVLYRKGRSGRYKLTANGEIFEGTILGTTEAGHLLMETFSGVTSFDLKEIQFLPG